MWHKYVFIICFFYLNPLLCYSNSEKDTFFIKGNVVQCINSSEQTIESINPIYVKVLAQDSVIASQVIASNGSFKINIPRFLIKGSTLEIYASQSGMENNIPEMKNIDLIDSETKIITDLKTSEVTVKLCMSKGFRYLPAPTIYFKNYSLDFFSDTQYSADSNMIRMVELCKKHPDIKLQITLRSTANELYSKSLNRKRANRIKSYLLSKGVKPYNVRLNYNVVKSDNCTPSDRCLAYFIFVVLKVQ